MYAEAWSDRYLHICNYERGLGGLAAWVVEAVDRVITGARSQLSELASRPDKYRVLTKLPILERGRFGGFRAFCDVSVSGTFGKCHIPWS